jgi:hypothetical protein
MIKLKLEQEEKNNPRRAIAFCESWECDRLSVGLNAIKVFESAIVFIEYDQFLVRLNAIVLREVRRAIIPPYQHITLDR